MRSTVRSTTMQHSPRERRASSAASASHKPEGRYSIRSSGSAEGHRRADRRPSHASRNNSDANLYTLYQDRTEHDFSDTYDSLERPPMSPRKLSQASKYSLASYGTKYPANEPPFNVNIAVLGNACVGKSTFIQKSLDLESRELSETPSRVLSISGNLCMVRMYEMSLTEVYQGEEDTLKWPGRIQSAPIHGTMTLYDVGNKASFKMVPEVLNAINKMSLPSVLAACKCDISHAYRQLEPKVIEQRATSAFDRITTLQTSELLSEPFLRAMSAVLSKVIKDQRPLVLSTSPHIGTSAYTSPVSTSPVSPRRPAPPLHSRSSNDILKSTRHDSKAQSEGQRLASESTSKSTSVSSYLQGGSSSSFLIEDVSSSDEVDSQTSLSVQDTDGSDDETEVKGSTPRPRSEELGWTFDALVNRLLAVPKSKADSKFAAVFLALYRKFAPPGQLLEAIVVRFEEMEHDEPVMLTRTAAQLRYLTVVEQWIHLYPGDFAHPKTLRRIRTFICKLQRNRIFATAAQEMNNDLRHVTEDDDTEWAYCDKARKEHKSSTTDRWTYRGSLLIDDPNFKFPDAFSNLSLRQPGDAKSSPNDWMTMGSALRQTHLPLEDIAQREASKLVPSQRYPMTKNSWRALLDIPSEQIAKELTRMDWIMFSSIRPRDLVRHVSLTAAAKLRCKSLANVSRMIEHFNHTRDFTMNYILYRDKPKHRAQMLDKLISVARALRELNNYNSLGAVLAGIHSTAVARLSATQALLTPDANKDRMKLEILMANTRSYGSYRLAWENTTSARIPYLPLPIRDLVGAESGNRTFLDGSGKGCIGPPPVGIVDEGDDMQGAVEARTSSDTSSSDGPSRVQNEGEAPVVVGGRRINWCKFEVMGDVLVGIQRAQGLPYRSDALGPKNDEIRTLWLHSRIERDEEALHARSVALEGHHSAGKGFMKGFLKR